MICSPSISNNTRYEPTRNRYSGVKFVNRFTSPVKFSCKASILSKIRCRWDVGIFLPSLMAWGFNSIWYCIGHIFWCSRTACVVNLLWTSEMIRAFLDEDHGIFPSTLDLFQYICQLIAFLVSISLYRKGRILSCLFSPSKYSCIFWFIDACFANAYLLKNAKSVFRLK